MNITTEQIQVILDGAPEGATHFDGKTYFRFEMYEHGQAYLIMRRGVWMRGTPSYPCYNCLNISHLREILELRQEIGRLEAQLKELRNLREVDRVSDQSIELTFLSCRACSAFCKVIEKIEEQCDE